MDLYETVKPIPFFSSSSVEKAAKFYADVLNFTTHVNPGMVSIGGGPKTAVNIYIFERSKRRGCCMVMLRRLEDVDAMHKHLIEKGVQLVEELPEWTGLGFQEQQPARIGPVEDKEWGYRQFDLLDIDGNNMCFFAFLSEE